MSLNPIKELESLINKFGTNTIIRERLALVNDVLREQDKKLAELKANLAHLQAELEEKDATTVVLKGMNTDLNKALSEKEAEINRYSEWETNKKCYKLTSVGPGAVAYVYIPSVVSGIEQAPIHYLCPHCFEQRKKGYLQRTSSSIGGYTFTCSLCGSIVKFGLDIVFQ